MRWMVVLLLSLAVLLSGGEARAAERRVALIVGNGAYRTLPRLVNPANDARLIAEALKADGFELVGGKPLIDTDKTALERAIRNFGQALRGGAIGLFYYSGHGVQINGTNYVVPVSADITDELDTKFELVAVDLVLDVMAAARNRLNFVMLDACRNNPFGGRGLRDIGAGLAVMSVPAGTVISYATQPGNVAQDGVGKNSPYTDALAAAIRRPGLDLFGTFNEVGLRVKEATAGQQQPWLALSPIEGQFFFAPAAPETSQLPRNRAEQTEKAEPAKAAGGPSTPSAATAPPAAPGAPAPDTAAAPAPQFCGGGNYQLGCRDIYGRRQ